MRKENAARRGDLRLDTRQRFDLSFTDEGKPAAQCVTHSPHLLQIGVAPYLPICKDPGNQAALAVILQPLGGGSSLQGTDLPAAGAAHINGQQLTAGHPQDRVACGVIYYLQEELPVIIINLLRPQGAIIINRKNVPSVYLWERLSFKNGPDTKAPLLQQ